MASAFDYQTLKSLAAPGRYTDPLTKGLHLWVKPSLQKYWIYRYTLQGKRRNLGLGAFPATPIKEARLKAQRACLEVSEGLDPIEQRMATKAPPNAELKGPTFEEFALSWVSQNQGAWKNSKHAAQWVYTLREFAFPHIGDMEVKEISEADILRVLQPIWLDKTETASRLRGRLERILSAARVQGLRDGFNPATWKGHLEAVLPSAKRVKRQKGEKHHKALPYRAIPGFMARLREQGGLGALALEFTILTASRTSEVLKAKKVEVQDDLWIIPPERMKAGKEHRVPLCRRALEILEIARYLSEHSEYLFSTKPTPMSNAAMSSVLKRMSVDVTVHGFRSTFRDWVAEETDHSHEVAEMALAHTVANKVEAAYRRGDLLQRRRKLAEDWQAYCESTPAGNVISLMAA